MRKPGFDDIFDNLDSSPRKLSRGEKQMVALYISVLVGTIIFFSVVLSGLYKLMGWW